MVVFEADDVESTDDKYIFTMEDETIGEFERKNVAGYFAAEEINEDGYEN